MLLALLLATAAPEGAHGGAAAHHPVPPLIDVDGTVLIQFVLFMIVLFVLRSYVFMPFLKAQEEREDSVEGERRRAKEMDETARAKIAAYEARLAAAKLEGMHERGRFRDDGSAREREIIERARIETTQLLEQQKAAAAKAAETARQSLRASSSDWAFRLASRILGREVR